MPENSIGPLERLLGPNRTIVDGGASGYSFLGLSHLSDRKGMSTMTYPDPGKACRYKGMTNRTELTIIVTFPNGAECTRIMSYNLDAVEAVKSFQRGRTGPYAIESGETYRIEEITAC